GNVMIGYSPIYEYAALPDVQRIVTAMRKSISMKQERAAAETKIVAAVVPTAESKRKALGTSASTAKIDMPTHAAKSITVPIMGEGIRSAKIVSLLKNPGDVIGLDDALCEVETDKAVYPIESSFAGTMDEWKVEVGDTVEIGQELGMILVDADKDVEAVVSAAESIETGRHGRPYTIDPALSPTITRKLSRVIPAN